jgi:hypothetical protein
MQYSFRGMLSFLVAAACLSVAPVTAAGQNSAIPSPEKKTTSSKTTTAKKTVAKKPTVAQQLQQLTEKLTQQQTQIQQQQSQIQQLQQTNGTLQQQVQQQGQTLQSSVQQATQQASAAQEGVNSLHTTVTDLQSTTQATANALLENKKAVNSLENPLAIHYKGITITPGGWLESTFLVRSHNENADITSNFGAVPFSNVANNNLSEFRGSARGSRAILAAEGNAGSTKLTGYLEIDFLGQAPTANYVETNSFTPRQRQLWGQAEFKNGVTFTAGQFWSLMTTDRKGIATRSEFIPTTIEGSYVVGYTYARQNAVRVVKNISNRTWLAFEIANPETTLSTSYTPSNLMGFNTSSNALTPNGSTLNYLSGSTNGLSTNLAPDFAGKVAFEPGWGHFELKGLVRMFRDRIAETETAPGNTNVTAGGGIGWAAILPLAGSKLVSNNRNWTQKVDFVFEGMAGKGIGRYGAANQPDVTLEPNGNIVPLPAIHALAGFEFHPQPKLDIYLYGGDEYVGSEKFSTINSAGKIVPAGYGSYLVNNVNCQVEVIPEGGAACGAQNKNIWDTTTGLWYRIYKGPFGTFQYGLQVAYIQRNAWSGKGGSPTGNDLVGETAVRFYLP